MFMKIRLACAESKAKDSMLGESIKFVDLISPGHCAESNYKAHGITPEAFYTWTQEVEINFKKPDPPVRYAVCGIEAKTGGHILYSTYNSKLEAENDVKALKEHKNYSDGWVVEINLTKPTT